MNDVRVDAYQRAHEHLARFMERDHERIGELGRSLVFDHGHATPRVALLFHGLTASPTQFIVIAQSLYERGYNVFVPRLPRHGYRDRMSEALAGMTGTNLRAAVDESLAIARGLGERVVVAGFSLGGLLALHVAQHEPVERVVAISPFLGVAFVPGLLRLPLASLALVMPNRFYWWDPLKRERQMPAHGYPRYSTHALAHMMHMANELLREARHEPPRAEQIVFVLNASEAAVNNRATARLAKLWHASRPRAVLIRRLTDLPLSHDIIEPKRDDALAQRVLPTILEAIDA